MGPGTSDLNLGGDSDLCAVVMSIFMTVIITKLSTTGGLPINTTKLKDVTL